MQQNSASAGEKPFPLGFREFVVLIAALMAINALSIDPMLPALPAIGEALDVADPNRRQWVLIAYFFGISLGSLFYGMLSDRFGRRPVLLSSTALFLVATLACALAQSFWMLLAARLAAGTFAAGTRIVALSVVRDRFRGDAMASVISLIFIVIIIVPMVAPAFGQLVLYLAGWRWIFGALLVISGTIGLWAMLRLPETLEPENRVEMRLADLAEVVRRVVTHRVAIGYMLATGVINICFVGFLSTVQQIFADVFDRAAIFPYVFAGIAGMMAVGSWFNSKLVHRFGARRMSHGSLIMLIASIGLHTALALAGYESLLVFVFFQSMMMLTLAFVSSNFGAIALEPFARGAGLAASFHTSLTNMVSAVGGALIGAQFNGTTLPLNLGLLGCSLISLALIVWAEHGRLFTRPGHQDLRPVPGEV